MGLREDCQRHEDTAVRLARLLEEIEDAVTACEDKMVRDRVLRIAKRRLGIMHENGTGNSLFGE